MNPRSNIQTGRCRLLALLLALVLLLAGCEKSFEQEREEEKKKEAQRFEQVLPVLCYSIHEYNSMDDAQRKEAVKIADELVSKWDSVSLADFDAVDGNLQNYMGNWDPDQPGSAFIAMAETEDRVPAPESYFGGKGYIHDAEDVVSGRINTILINNVEYALSWGNVAAGLLGEEGDLGGYSHVPAITREIWRIAGEWKSSGRDVSEEGSYLLAFCEATDLDGEAMLEKYRGIMAGQANEYAAQNDRPPMPQGIAWSQEDYFGTWENDTIYQKLIIDQDWVQTIYANGGSSSSTYSVEEDGSLMLSDRWLVVNEDGGLRVQGMEGAFYREGEGRGAPSPYLPYMGSYYNSEAEAGIQLLDEGTYVSSGGTAFGMGGYSINEDGTLSIGGDHAWLEGESLFVEGYDSPFLLEHPLDLEDSEQRLDFIYNNLFYFRMGEWREMAEIVKLDLAEMIIAVWQLNSETLDEASSDYEVLAGLIDQAAETRSEDDQVIYVASELAGLDAMYYASLYETFYQ